MILFRKQLRPEVLKINYSCFDHPRRWFFSKGLSGIELKFASKECLMKRVRRFLLSFLSRHNWVNRFFNFVKSHCVLSPQLQGSINVGKIRLVTSERIDQVYWRAVLVPKIWVACRIGVDRHSFRNERGLNLIELVHQLILVKELWERPHLLIDFHFLVKFLIDLVVFWKNTRHNIFLLLLEPSHHLIKRFPLGQFGLLSIWDKVIESIGLGVLGLVVLGGMRKRKMGLGCLVGESLKLNVEL